MDIYTKKQQKEDLEKRARVINRMLRKFNKDLEKSHLLNSTEVRQIKSILKS